MKWSLSQLRKFKDNAFTFNQNIQLEDVTDRRDIFHIHDIEISGDILHSNRRFDVNLHIEADVSMIDSRSGEPVIYPLSIDTVEIFDESIESDSEIDEQDDNLHPVLHEIDLEPIVRELIIVNIPNVYTESESLPSSSNTDNWKVFGSEEELEKERPVDPRLQKLQSLFNSDETED
ncbi:YceD family protein [Phocicoccus pinnipedialis]|uniref:DUF177 domain-containing protein n=1 Tax=Phocicoccus pinnipedialis TaxID=110845 RepID=A0A6V7RGR4_9BACL|nr:YceD family protein [Jeotgalicoccus pinnipedialis]MBP1939030.1 uncharacterized protein [Jeotgalicoccus pinnipedialis]CAD2077100.1 hypothetical protein JEOPIN946_01408 [Jeotgalicoccus pinnipedialis]